MKIIICLFFLFISVLLLAQKQTFVKDYTYHAGDEDSKNTARANALAQVKKILLEEVGVFIQTETNIKKQQVAGVSNDDYEQKIQSITAGITETNIIEEKWTGAEYIVKASITVDKSDVNKNIERIMQDNSNTKELVEIKKRADDALVEIQKLKKELAASKSEVEKVTKQKQFVESSNLISATEWLQKGSIAYWARDFDETIRCYQKAVELDPKNSEVLMRLANAYVMKTDKWAEVKQTYDKVFNLDSTEFRHEMALLDYGLACRLSGDYDKAIKLYDKAIKLNPKSSTPYYWLGELYEEKNNLDKAIKMYEKAIELRPKYSYYYRKLGDVYDTKGNPDKSLELYKKAAKLGDKDAQKWLTENGYTW